MYDYGLKQVVFAHIPKELIHWLWNDHKIAHEECG